MSVTTPSTINQSKTCASIPTELRLSAEQAEHIAALSKALSHPVRVQIVDISEPLRWRGVRLRNRTAF